MLTVADWNDFPDDLLRHEIIAGKHYTQRGATVRHQRVLMNLEFRLHPYAETRGELSLHVVGTVLSETDAVIPDIVYVRRDRREFLDKQYIDVPPDLIAEVILDETREVDRTVKRDLYERTGVGEYWIIDPDDSSVAVYRRAGESLRRVETSDPITTPLLPGFEITFAELFA